MSFQICTKCGDDFAGDDEDLECNDCLIEKISECEEKTGHEDTIQDEGDIVCAGCGIIV